MLFKVKFTTGDRLHTRYIDAEIFDDLPKIIETAAQAAAGYQPCTYTIKEIKLLSNQILRKNYGEKISR